MSHTCGHTALQMEAEQSHMTEMICDLALEIIYLLTGEKHAAVKMASIEGFLRGVYPPLSVGGGLSQTPIMKPPAHSWIPESNNQKILEVTSKITELLVGEVSGAGNSGAGCSFMEERGNGEKDHRLHTAMEDQPHLTSQDGSRKRNPPERRPHPVSWDCAPEYLEIPHHLQLSDERKGKEVKEEDGYVGGDEEIPAERPRSSAQESYHSPQRYKEENLVIVKQEEELYVRVDEWYKEEEGYNTPQLCKVEAHDPGSGVGTCRKAGDRPHIHQPESRTLGLLWVKMKGGHDVMTSHSPPSSVLGRRYDIIHLLCHYNLQF